MSNTTGSESAPATIDVEFAGADGPGAWFQLSAADDTTWLQLSDRLAVGDMFAVGLGVADLDTEGHAVAADEIVLDLYIDGDVEGHAIRLRFPGKEEAAAFRRAVLTAGRFEGSMQVDPTTRRVALRPGAQINGPQAMDRG